VKHVAGPQSSTSWWNAILVNLPHEVQRLVAQMEKDWSEKPLAEIFVEIKKATQTYLDTVLFKLSMEKTSIQQRLNKNFVRSSGINNKRERPFDEASRKKKKVDVETKETKFEGKCLHCGRLGHKVKTCNADGAEQARLEYYAKMKEKKPSEGKKKEKSDGKKVPKFNINKQIKKYYSGGAKCDRLYKSSILRVARANKMYTSTKSGPDLYTTYLAINGKQQIGICDSFATHSFVNRAFIELCGLGPLYSVPDVEVRLGDGSIVKPLGVEVLVHHKESCRKHVFYCIDMVSTEPELIIGLDLFLFLGVQFNHRRKVFVNSKHWDNFTCSDENEPRKFVLATNGHHLANGIAEVLREEIEKNQAVTGFSPIGQVKIPCTKMKNVRPYPLPAALRFQIAQKVKEWYTETDGKQVVEDSKCVEHSLPLVIVRKKNGSIRICLDLRFVNENSPYDTNMNQSIPRIKQLKKFARRYKYFAALDVREAFTSLELEESSRKFTTFLFEGKRYQFHGVPFGLAFLPAHFQTVMESLFVDMPWANPYVDDILVGADTPEELRERLKSVIGKLTENNFKLNMEKSVLISEQIHVLGSILGKLRV
jgi:hypothetical protein